MVQMVKNLPTIQETQVRSLGQEDPLEEGMAIHSGILAWRIPWTEEPGGLQSTGHKDLDVTDQPWDFFGRNDAKAETPVLWPPHVKS